MVNRHGYIGAVPTQDKDNGNKGLIGVNSGSILKRRDQIKTDNLPPVFSGKTLRFYLDATQENSYSGSGSTWSDLSGNGYNGTLSNASFTSGNPSYFSLSDSFNINMGNVLTSNLTMFWVMQTNDTQSLFATSATSADYLGAYRSGNKYYHSNVGGNRTLYINGSSANNPYDSLPGSTSRSVIISDCDFNFQNQNYQFNTYDGYRFGDGKLYAMGAYTGNLTSTDASNLHSHFNDLGYTGI